MSSNFKTTQKEPAAARGSNAKKQSATRAQKRSAPPQQEPQAPDDINLLDSKAAAALLGVKTQTLYAYVSRGLIKPAPRHGAQASLYHREDIEALRAGGRSSPPTLDQGERSARWNQSGALLQTAITNIKQDGPYYRGKSAIEIAMSRPFEDCADLLWNGVLPSSRLPWRPAHLPEAFIHISPIFKQVAEQCSSWQLLALITHAYSASVGRNPEHALGAPVLAGHYLIKVLAPALGLFQNQQNYAIADEPQSVAQTIIDSLSLQPSEGLTHALNACLILSADHELAPATFAARISASTGADIFSCVSSALGSFDGPLTGYGCNESERMLCNAKSAKDYVEQLRGLTAIKEPIPGYNHPLYPDGDPRATYLLELVRNIDPTQASKNVLNSIDACREEFGLRPSLAIGLVAICAAFGLPRESAGTIMAIGRVAGWLAHVFEQRLDGQLVRPRTKYIGPL